MEREAAEVAFNGGGQARPPAGRKGHAEGHALVAYASDVRSGAVEVEADDPGAHQRHPVMIIRADLAPSPPPRAALEGCSRQQMLLGLPYVHGYVRAFCWSLDRDLVRQLLRGGIHDQPPQQAQVLPGKPGRTEFDEQLLLLSCHPPAQLPGPLPGKPLASASSTRPYSRTVRPLDGESSVAWDEGDDNRQERRHALEDLRRRLEASRRQRGPW